MKQGLFIFAIFFILTTTGCMSSENTPELKPQGFESTLNGQAGQAQRLGAAVKEGRSEWPGDTVDTNITNTNGGAADGGIILLNITSPVNRGETGSLSIQGKPAVQYTVTAVYNKLGRTFTSTIEKRAGADGIVNWTWNVSKDTEPGKYDVMITGGKKVFTTAYVVAR